MTAKPTSERMAAMRQRREAQGLTRVEVFAHPDDVEAIKKYAAKKRKARMKSGDMAASDIYATFAMGNPELTTKARAGLRDMPPLEERLREHAAARVNAARVELAEALVAQQDITGTTPCPPCDDTGDSDSRR